MIRFIPGIVGAAAGFIAFEIVQSFGVQDLGWEIITFFGAYIIVTVVVDRALRSYGKERVKEKG